MPTKFKKLFFTSIIIIILFLNTMNCVSLFTSINFGPVDVTLNENIKQSAYKRIAVVPYDVSGYDGMGRDKVSGTALADRYTNELMKAGYDVIERQRLESVINEQKLSMTGLVSPETSVKVGKILGVQGFVFGSVSGKPDAFSVMSKLVDVETGSTVWSIVISNNIEKNAIIKLKETMDKYYTKGGK
jgi:TolB-like protein